MSLNELTGLPLEVGEDQDGGVVDDSPEPGAGLGQDLLHSGPGTGDTFMVGHVELGDDDQPAGVGADGLEVVSAPGVVLSVAGSHHHQPSLVTEGGQAETQAGVAACDEDGLVRVPGGVLPTTWR